MTDLFKKTFIRTLIIFVAMTAFFAIRQYPHDVPLHFTGAKLPGNIGKVFEASRIAEEGKDSNGALTYGPYVKLMPGKYSVTIKYSATSETSGSWDMIFQGASVIIKSGKLPTKARGLLSESVTVSDDDKEKALEIRVWYTGKGSLKVEELLIERQKNYPVVLVISEGLLASFFIILIFLLYSSTNKASREKSAIRDTAVKNAAIVLLLILFIIVCYPFDFGRGVFRIFYCIGIIYFYLFFLGFGLYFYLTPDFMKTPPMLASLTIGYGVLLLSIINIYVISMNMNIRYSLYLSLLMGATLFLLLFFSKYKLVFTAFDSVKKSFRTSLKTLVMISLLLFIALSPVLRSDIPTTPCHVDIDQTGYAQTAQYLLEGGTLKLAASDIQFQVDTNDLDTAISENNTALKFNSIAQTDFLFKAGAEGINGLISVFALVTGSDHVYQIQFISLSIVCIMLFGFSYFFMHSQLNLSDSHSILLSLAIILNCNILNVYYEGMNAQFLATPFLFLLIIGYAKLRQTASTGSFLGRNNEFLSNDSVRFMLFFAVLLAGTMSIYNVAFIIFIVFVVASILLDVLFLHGINRSILGFLSLSLFIACILNMPHSMQFFTHFIWKIKWMMNVGGFWQPQWASPAEILGIFNIYIPEYMQKAPALLKRGEVNYFLNFIFTIAILLVTAFYCKDKSMLDRSFWLAAPAFVLVIFIKAYYIDHMHNYTYMKAYTIFLPILLIFVFKSLDFYLSKTDIRFHRLTYTIVYLLVVSIIINGAIYIKQYNSVSKTVTDDMFNLFEFNRQNKNIFNSYVFITNKADMEEFMIVPLIPFHWLNQGIYKNPKPHLENKVALFVRKTGTFDETSLHKFRRNLIFENDTFFVLDTDKQLKDSYDPTKNQSSLEYYTNEYKGIFQL